LEKARSPVGETARFPLVLFRYLQGSPIAQKLPELAEGIKAEWQGIRKALQLANQSLPAQFIFISTHP
jgi:hypothetical protein